jgi:hypothetical protein
MCHESEASRPKGRRFPGRYFFLYCAPSFLPVGTDPALKGGAGGALAGQPSIEKKWKWVSP